MLYLDSSATPTTCPLLIRSYLQIVYWGLLSGVSRDKLNKLWLKLRLLWVAQQFSYLCLNQSTPPSCGGASPPNSRVIQVQGGHWQPSVSVLWWPAMIERLMSFGLWVRARFVLKIKHLINLPLVCFILFLFLPALGLILPWISLLVFLHPVAILQSLLLWIAFLKWLISFPSLNSLLLGWQVVIDHDFQIHCLPEDMVSERGP